MWKKHSNGFYIAEILLSLSGWIIIASVLVPLLMQVNKQTLQLREKSDALHILYEYTQTVILENPVKENHFVDQGNKQYELRWHWNETDGNWEVSIHYEDIFGDKVEIYETIQ